MSDPKSDLRARMRALRATLAAAAPDAGTRLALPLSPRIVAGYRPFRDEIDPLPLMLKLAAAGARLALPVTPPRDQPSSLTFHAWSPGEALAAGGFGVHEPTGGEVVIPDLILVPLLAFDRRGHRLGYGQGHFDRTLEALRKTGAITAVGLAYAGQEVAGLPDEPHDQALDAILTEKEYIRVRKD
ncbi:5-formyltetrahydrofolate cyclo-ligase [Caulobacter ginsengisoli]|uniref:5-formyltetrahydrofolate cyclo-ligase n=1 Tax=Caulobacter ginsengisoli TaxID=400775 RepID=A0ABU0IT04_9CAUL|nr:5-formyltetrahydrofolate cyclo-ligase [Caulobacter ginsengisoli]MDQ0465130.1 5-formyltetrahydrofolate cyclo-ligase [Caulobacter ginsengisoli]